MSKEQYEQYLERFRRQDEEDRIASEKLAALNKKRKEAIERQRLENMEQEIKEARIKIQEKYNESDHQKKIKKAWQEFVAKFEE